MNLQGGARIGIINAGWPFVNLIVTKNSLKLFTPNAGNFIFEKDDIISIKPYYSIPLIGRGIILYHKIPEYDNEIIFWTFKNPKKVLSQINEIGFLKI